MQFTDTIFALSSGRLPSGVAVVRISGPSVRFVVETIAGEVPRAGRMTLKKLRSGDGWTIDTGLVVFFEAPRSFTGEDAAEFHVHGGRAIVEALLRLLGSYEGLRHAESGEFTRRAFLNGKMDLVQAEALGDLIQAETEAQRRMAMRASEGHVSRLYEGWRRRLLAVQAAIVADLDFSDESDVPDSVAERIGLDISLVRAELEEHLSSSRQVEIIHDGYQVVLVGPPNAGKSSLLNVLAGRDAAIVTDEPGTTRDLLDVALDLGGLKVVVTDTAGMRDGAGSVEKIGIERALARARTADLVVELSPPDQGAGLGRSWANSILVRSKCDMDPCRQGGMFGISTVTGEGIDSLIAEIRARAEAATAIVGDGGPQKLRHRLALQRCAEALGRAGAQMLAIELVAEELRSASSELGRITGRIEVEEILGEVFSTFCIGK